MNKNLLIALGTTCLTFCTLYAPQPILPLLSAEFGVRPTTSALLISVTLAPFAFAPIIYGYFLQAIPARSMLRIAVALLILDQFAFFFATQFWHLLALRIVQGLLMPAIFTALMTYCATMAAPGKMRKTMGWYIGATILGGFLSRTLSGIFTDWFGWHYAFVIWGVMLLPVWIMLRYIDADAEINFDRLDVQSIKRVLAKPLYRNIYLVLFTVFFGFSGIINLLAFRLSDLHDSISAFQISLLYVGYLAGIPVAILSERLLGVFGTVARAVLFGLGVYASVLLMYLLPNATALFIIMFVFAASMFFIHSNLSGLVNDIATEHKGVVNGLYVAVYYLSGALGSWLAGYVYLHLGWETLIMIMLVMLIGAANSAMKIRA